MAREEIGTIIRQKRESLRISQEAVAFVLEISQAAYSKIERNETKGRAGIQNSGLFWYHDL